MADELDPVEQRFIAQVESYVDEVRRAAEDARRFADANVEAKVAVDGMRDHAEEAGAALGHVRDEAVVASEAVKHLGDEGRDTGLKLAAMRDMIGATSGEGIFGNWFVSMFAGSKMQMIITGVMSVFAALPALIGGVGALAGIAFAGYFLDKSGKISGGVTQLMSTLKSVMASAVEPMIAPLNSALTQLGSFLRQIGPQIRGAFSALAPLVQPFVYALEGLVGGVLPGLISMFKAAAPAVQALAGFLGEVGANLGRMFGAFATVMGPSSTALKALLDLVASLLPVISGLASTMAGALAPVMVAVGAAFRAAEPVITIVGRILGALAEAVLGNLAGGLTAVAGIVRATAPAFARLAGAVSQAFNLMENRGVLNDLEDAVEELVGPLSRLIIVLVSGLTPALPAVISLLGSMADMLQSGLVTVIGGLANALAGLITAIPPGALKAIAEGLLLWAVYAKALGPAKALISGVGSAFSWVVAMPGKLAEFGASLVQGAENVLMFGVRVVTQAAEAAEATGLWIAEHTVAATTFIAENIAMAASATVAFIAENAATLGIVAGIAVLIGAIVFLATHWKTVWHDITAVVDDAVSFVEKHWLLLVEILTGTELIAIVEKHWREIQHAILSVVDDVVRFVREHWRMLVEILGTLAGPVGFLVAFIVTHWAEFRRVTAELVDDVVGFFERLPGRILAELAALPGQLLGFGRSIIDGLLHGVEDAAGGLLGEVGKLAGDVSHAFSDVLGIFSPSRVFYQHAVNTWLGYINATRAMAPQVLAAVRAVSGTIGAQGAALGAGGGYGPAGAGGSGGASLRPVNVTVPITMNGQADARFYQGLQTAVQEAVLRYSLNNPGNGLLLPKLG